MTETAVSPPNEPLAPPAPPAPPAPASTDGFFLDGAAPRLGDAPAAVPPRAEPVEGTTDEPTTSMAPPPAPAPTAPMAPAGEATAPAPPQIDAADLPSLPTAAPATPATTEVAAESDAGSSGEDGDHPLAHLMPTKAAPSAAQQRAAELRAARKAKSKKIKIGVAIGALTVSALAGPPLVSWLTTAINEAGSTTSDDE